MSHLRMHFGAPEDEALVELEMMESNHPHHPLLGDASLTTTPTPMTTQVRESAATSIPQNCGDDSAAATVEYFELGEVKFEGLEVLR